MGETEINFVQHGDPHGRVDKGANISFDILCTYSINIIRTNVIFADRKTPMFEALLKPVTNKLALFQQVANKRFNYTSGCSDV